jgi:hypothetical protein
MSFHVGAASAAPFCSIEESSLKRWSGHVTGILFPEPAIPVARDISVNGIAQRCWDEYESIQDLPSAAKPPAEFECAGGFRKYPVAIGQQEGTEIVGRKMVRLEYFPAILSLEAGEQELLLPVVP